MNDKNSDYVGSETHGNQKQFICDICQKIFFARVQYQVHSITHLLPEHFNCRECEEGFTQILNLDKHLEMHNNSMFIICHVCKKGFFDIDSLNEHAKDHKSVCTNALIVKQETDVEEIPLKVYNNGKSGSEYLERDEQYAIESHILSDNEKSFFRCDRCKEEFSEMHHLDEHCKSLCIKKELNSDKCEESVTFTSIDDFHVSEDDEEDDDDDDLLSSYFNENSEKYALQNHISTDSLQNLFSCDRCKMLFPEKHHLEEHQQRLCVKKELNSDEDGEIVAITSVPLLFHARDDKISSSQISQKRKNVNAFSNKWQKQKNINGCSRNSPEMKQFICEVCQKKFSNKYSLTIHFSTHSDQKTFNCNLCEKKFVLKCLLSAHVRIHKAKKVFCDVCQEGFASKETLFNHVNIHAESFSCDYCGLTFYEMSLLEKHYVNHIKEEPPGKEYKCRICSKILPNVILLNVHELSHSTSRPYVCNVCSKKFSRSNNLLRHYLIHTEEKPFKCETCEKSFRQESDVTKHFNKVHTYKKAKFPHSINWREKNFKCETCGKRFTSKQSLMGHQFQHTGETPHVCEICNKGFARKFQLKDHLPSHSGEKPFKCKTCGKKFATKSTLRVHSAVHGEYTPFICEVCQKGFGKMALLTKHRRVHTGERPFVCSLCPKRFNQKSHLVTHLQGVHKNKL